MRIIKQADERKNEILNAANELFVQKGYDGTSVSDILEKVGIAKGTLYHHFKSKEDILDSLIERFNTRVLEVATKISQDNSVPIPERMVKVVLALDVSESEEGTEMIELLHKPQNALMQQKSNKMLLETVTPILANLLSEGIGEGIFDTNFTYETTEMIIVYALTVFSGNNFELTKEEMVSRINAFIYNMERLFGAKSGSLIGFLQVFGLEDK